MCLVDSDETDVHMAEFRLEQFRREALGRHVEDLHGTEDAILEGDDNLFAGESRINSCSTDATAEEVLYLILHQGDEGSNHNTSAFL